MTTIVPAQTRVDYEAIADLANRIWTEHYTPIIGEQQVAYMLEKFQSVLAIEDQVEQGFSYYLLTHQNTYVGYFSFSTNDEYLFLSKLYVLNSARGNGIGKAALSFVEEQVKERGLGKIQLTVNKYNFNSIKAYEKMGFINSKAIVQDIGSGYVMDDYVLEKVIK
jgi:ribosomal protein S18 acetylase RimI-like enzyme